MSDCKIFAKTIEDAAKQQIDTLISTPAFKDAKVRIMPDVHAGVGCVIGFTANLGDKIIPNIVGVDIGCGMQVIRIDKRKDKIDMARLDDIIRKNIPAGFAIRDEEYSKGVAKRYYGEMYCANALKESFNRFDLSLGTLGGGNHFIELDEDEDGNVYLVIHTGSRNLGVQVAKYYQQQAEITMDWRHQNHAELIKKNIIETCKKLGHPQEIEKQLAAAKKEYEEEWVPKELAYLTLAEGGDSYLHDMRLCQEYAHTNRNFIAHTIIYEMGWENLFSFETIHNYIDIHNIVRKGAVSAEYGQKLLIPMNMRDGSLLCVGKGNKAWNCSAPHGAGRLMSRAQAHKTLDMAQYEKEMSGIYTTSVSKSTLDESPMAYKDMNEIVNCIQDTVEIKHILKPIYNFKAA